MIFIDSNIPMYMIGNDHPNKNLARTLLERLVAEKQSLVTNTEVLQEILHRYSAIHRKEAIQPAFDLVYEIIDEVFDVTEKVVLGAKDLLLSYSKLSARDAIHAAHMKLLKIDTIFTFDQGFDFLPRIKRISE
jgi:predicted nucleic acid-binding protein